MTDYTDCIEEIAESLKKGEHIPIETELYGGMRKDRIVGYVAELALPYIGVKWNHAASNFKILPKIMHRVKGPIDLMNELLSRGYKCDKRNGEWYIPLNDDDIIKANIFYYCYREYSEMPINMRQEWMFEKIECDLI